MTTLFRIHSDVRWVIVAVLVAAAVRLAVGLLRKEKSYSKNTRLLMLIFSTLIDIQVVLGLIYFIWNGEKHDFWPRYRVEHLITMLIAVAVVHMAARWRKAAARLRYRNDLIVLIVTLLLIVVGVARLPGNRW